VTVRLLFLSIVATAALVMVGCSQETAGDAAPSDGGATGRPTIPTQETDATDSTETTETQGGESGTADLQPCDMLTSEEQSQLQVSGGTEDEVGPARSCEWTASGSYKVAVGMVDELGLDDVQSSGPKKTVKIGSHDAVQFTGGISSCAFALGVTDTSRVDVLSAANGDEAKACSVAKQAAELVEPKLP
jgi:hypothetical protein